MNYSIYFLALFIAYRASFSLNFLNFRTRGCKNVDAERKNVALYYKNVIYFNFKYRYYRRYIVTKISINLIDKKHLVSISRYYQFLTFIIKLLFGNLFSILIKSGINK